MNYSAIINVVLAGGVGAAVVKLFESVLLEHIQHKSKNHEACMARLEAEMQKVQTILETHTEAERAILHDRLKYLGKRYIRQGCIDYDDYADYTHMFSAYSSLGEPNGIHHLMNAIKKLEIVDEKKAD